MFNDLVRIGFPKNCLSCSNSLVNNELFICTNCYFYIPKGELAINQDTETGKLFEKNKCFHGSSHLLNFDKNGKTQHILHELKYNSNIRLGEYLGSLIASEFEILLKDIDYILPVPLHPKKEHQRGYNQSLVISNGINSVLGIPVSKNNLIRIKYTETQTKKNKSERIKNMNNAFDLRDINEFKGKTLLLLDDVITTGSTLNECIRVLSEIKDVKIKTLLLAKANI